MRCSCSATRAWILAVSWSRKAEIATCSSRGGTTTTRFRTFSALRLSCVLLLASATSCGCRCSSHLLRKPGEIDWLGSSARIAWFVAAATPSVATCPRLAYIENSRVPAGQTSRRLERSPSAVSCLAVWTTRSLLDMSAIATHGMPPSSVQYSSASVCGVPPLPICARTRFKRVTRQWGGSRDQRWSAPWGSAHARSRPALISPAPRSSRRSSPSPPSAPHQSPPTPAAA